MKTKAYKFWVLRLSLFMMFPNEQNACAQVVLNGKAQGSTYHIFYFDERNRDLQYDIDSLLEKFDLSLSTYDTASIISRINRDEPHVKTDLWFETCFQTALEVWKNTDGAFDPTVYPLVNAWGWGPGKKQSISKNRIDSILQLVGLEKVRLQKHQVFKKKGIGLDFNAFAQGYSVDVVSEYLISKGIFNFVVEIGGEARCMGHQPSGESFIMGIEKPSDNPESKNPVMLQLKLENKSMATSGNYRKYFIENGIKYAHHIDPKTGYPAKNNLLSASVISERCIIADAYATGLLVMGLEKSIAFIHSHPELQAVLIYADTDGSLKTYLSDGLQIIEP